MTAALIAVSLSDTIQRFGSYAGLAAVVGLGVLSLLYFAQAREVKRLREWAGRAPERAVEHEQRVQADAQRRVVAQPLSPATTAAKQAEAARTAAAAALYAKVPPPPPPPAPLVGPPGQLARPVVPASPASPGTVPAASGSSAVTTPGSTSPTTGASPPAAPALGAGPAAAVPPATTAAAAARQAAALSGSPSALGNGNGGQETHESDAARPDPPADPPAPLSSAVPAEGGGFSAARYGAIAGGAVAVVAIAGVLVFALTRGDDTTPKPNDFGSVAQPSASSAGPGGSSPNATAGAATSLNRRVTRVAVLNGTQQTGLARSVADLIQKAKFTVASVGNNADQQVPTTTVAYRAGNEHAAQIVAQAIGIDRGSVQAVDANTAAAADADVVVIVGTDKIE